MHKSTSTDKSINVFAAPTERSSALPGPRPREESRPERSEGEARRAERVDGAREWSGPEGALGWSESFWDTNDFSDQPWYITITEALGVSRQSGPRPVVTSTAACPNPFRLVDIADFAVAYKPCARRCCPSRCATVKTDQWTRDLMDGFGWDGRDVYISSMTRAKASKKVENATAHKTRHLAIQVPISATHSLVFTTYKGHKGRLIPPEFLEYALVMALNAVPGYTRGQPQSRVVPNRHLRTAISASREGLVSPEREEKSRWYGLTSKAANVARYCGQVTTSAGRWVKIAFDDPLFARVFTRTLIDDLPAPVFRHARSSAA